MPVGLGQTIAVYPPPAHLPTPVAEDDFRGDSEDVKGSSNLTLQQVRAEEEAHLQAHREATPPKRDEEVVTTLDHQLATARALVAKAREAEKPAVKAPAKKAESSK